MLVGALGTHSDGVPRHEAMTPSPPLPMARRFPSSRPSSATFCPSHSHTPGIEGPSGFWFCIVTQLEPTQRGGGRMGLTLHGRLNKVWVFRGQPNYNISTEWLDCGQPWPAAAPNVTQHPRHTSPHPPIMACKEGFLRHQTVSTFWSIVLGGMLFDL